MNKLKILWREFRWTQEEPKVRWTTTVWHLWDVATNKDAYEAALEWWDAIDQVREAEDNYLFVEDPAEAERLAARWMW